MSVVSLEQEVVRRKARREAIYRDFAREREPLNHIPLLANGFPNMKVQLSFLKIPPKIKNARMGLTTMGGDAPVGKMGSLSEDRQKDLFKMVRRCYELILS